jgi:radical SAM protein with 4Fe4S-binding SPASM domain
MKDPFAEIHKKCNTGTNIDKYNDLPEFPDVIDIELTNTCNLKCPMCPTGRRELTRKRGFMSWEVYLKIMKELKNTGTPIRMVRWGEPMLNKEFWTFLATAGYYDIPVHLNTNGYFLDESCLELFELFKLASIKISIHEESNKVMDTVKLLKKMKNTYTSVSVTSDEDGHDIWEAASANAKFKYRTYWPGKEYPRLPNCPEVFNKLSINWDGTISACCADYDNAMLIGDIRDNTIKEIWQGVPMNAYRDIIAQDKHWTLPVCRECFDLS